MLVRALSDSRGHFIKARTAWYDGVPNPMETETWGLKEATIWLDEMGMLNVSIELDCKLVTDGIGDKSTNQSEFSKIIHDYKIFLFNFPNLVWLTAKLILLLFA